MSKDTGGPAFPWDGNGDDGMTLRDYFAAKAMAGMLAHEDSYIYQPIEIADKAYVIADAMIKERSK